MSACLHMMTEEVVIAPRLVAAGMVDREVVADLCTSCLVDVSRLGDPVEIRSWGSATPIRTVNEVRSEHEIQRERIARLEEERRIHAQLDAAGL